MNTDRSIPVYRWPDGWTVAVFVDPDYLRDRHPKAVLPVKFILGRGPFDPDARWVVAHLTPNPSPRTPPDPVLSEWHMNSPSWPLPEVPKGEARRKLLGFVLDLGVRRPRSGILSNLLVQPRQKHLGGHREVPVPSLPYPRWVDDVLWERRYEEADRFVVRSGEGNQWGIEADLNDLFLGHVEDFRISIEHRLWRATCSGQSGVQAKDLKCSRLSSDGLPHDRYFHGIVDFFLDTELLLPSSSRTAWEAEHVVRGEWVLPSAEEVGLYRMLGEQLPLLWGYRRLLEWLREHP